MSKQPDIESVAGKLVELVTQTQFKILFEWADVPCPPDEFRICDDPSRVELGNQCLDCWRNFTRCQALLDLGFIHKIEMERGDDSSHLHSNENQDCDSHRREEDETLEGSSTDQ